MHRKLPSQEPQPPVGSIVCRSRVGERLNAFRLLRIPSRNVEFGALADAINIDLYRPLNPAALQREWEQVNNQLRDVFGMAALLKHSCNHGDRRALYQLVRHLRPRAVLEIGTPFGVSTPYIAAALQRNGRLQDGSLGQVVSVGIMDVDDPEHPWPRFDFKQSPRAMVGAAGLSDVAKFVACDSAEFLARTEQRFDFAYLDGSTAAAGCYRDLQSLSRVLKPDAVALLHACYPDGRLRSPDERPITGQWRAVTRLHSDGACIGVRPIGNLPWPTKGDSQMTSLALIGRVS